MRSASVGVRRIRRAAGVFAVVIGLAAASACGLGGEKPSTQGNKTTAKAGSIKPIASLKGAKIVVGSKDFTEQLVLGQMSIAMLQAAGAKPVDKTKITGSDSVRKALTGGSIDLYWEYLGTAWSEYLKHDEKVTDVKELATKVTDEDKKNGITWLPPSPLINTYAIATNATAAKKLKITQLSQLKTLPKSELTFCVGTEFYGRAGDGFKPMLKAYGVDPASVPNSQVHTMGDALVYDQVAKGDQCNFASTFSTDGRIAAKKLVLLKDDKAFFPLYNAAVNIRTSVYDKYPDLRKVFEPVSQKLTTETMQKLNGQVDIDGKDPSTVARDWLKQNGFIG